MTGFAVTLRRAVNRLNVRRSEFFRLSKIILLVVVAFGLYLLIKGIGRKAASARKDDVPAAKPVESMVACAHCDVNLPESEALADNGRFFCGEAHKRLGGR